MRAAVRLATAMMLLAVPVTAHAAVTKSTLLACKDEADLRTAVKYRTGGDRKVSAEFEKGKIEAGNCIIVQQNTVIGVDQRKPPLICIRPAGGLDCYWTVISAIDEFLTKPVAPKTPPTPKK
ncbi:MAG: hypothetical protein QOF41_3538 [Methylobacteriaceae bacterium]|nr:hypothetical protein [Methylobacteriaceae bacterium]